MGNGEPPELGITQFGKPLWCAACEHEFEPEETVLVADFGSAFPTFCSEECAFPEAEKYWIEHDVFDSGEPFVRVVERFKENDEYDGTEHSRRELLASGGVGVLGIGGIGGYLQFVHEPAPPLEVEITDGTEYVTDVTVPENSIPLFSEWDSSAFSITVSDALDADMVAVKLFQDGTDAGLHVVRDLPGTKEINFRATIQKRIGEYTAALYGMSNDPDKWIEIKEPPNRPADAEASFAITRGEER